MRPVCIPAPALMFAILACPVLSLDSAGAQEQAPAGKKTAEKKAEKPAKDGGKPAEKDIMKQWADLLARLGVLEHDLGKERLDADARRERGQALEESGSDAAALQLVGNCERHLCRARVAQAQVVRDGDDPVALRADERASLLPVGVEHGLDGARLDGGVAVETEIKALVRETAEERQQPINVLCRRRAKSPAMPKLKRTTHCPTTTRASVRCACATASRCS